MKLLNNIGDIGQFTVLLETSINDIYSFIFLPVLVYFTDIDACLEFAEYFTAYYFKAFSGFVIIISGFFSFKNCGVTSKAGFFNYFVHRSIPLFEERTQKHY